MAEATAAYEATVPEEVAKCILHARQWDEAMLKQKLMEPQFLDFVKAQCDSDGGAGQNMGQNVGRGVPLHKLSSDPSLAAGWRTVSLPGIQEKLVAMFQAEGWLGEMKVVRQGESDTLTYVSGHTRTCSLYCYLRMSFDLKLELPKWIQSMAQSVPVVLTEEPLSLPDRQIRGLVKCVEATILARSFSYIALVRLMDNLSLDVGQLKDYLKKSSLPKGAIEDEKIFPWQPLPRIVKRVSKSVHALLWELSEEMGGCDAFPAAWWRKPEVLLPSEIEISGQKSISEESQVLWAGRVAFEVRKLVAKELPGAPGLELRRMVPGLATKVNQDTRDRFRELAVLFEKHALKNPEYQWSAEEKVVLRRAFWNGSHDDVLPVASGTLPAVRQVIQSRQQQQQEQSAKELSERVAQMRAEMMTAATTEDVMESGHKVWRSVLKEKHHAFHTLAEKCVSEALKALTQSEEKRKEQEQTQAARQFELSLLRASQEQLPMSWQQRMGGKKVVAITDLNLVEGSQPLSLSKALLNELRLRDDALLIFLLPAGGSITGEEVELLGLLHGAKLQVRRVVIQFLSSSPPWAKDATVVQMVLAFSGTGWAHERQASSQEEIWESKMVYTPTLLSPNRHPYGNGRAWGMDFYKQLLSTFSLLGEKTDKVLFLELDIGQGQLLEVLLKEGGGTGMFEYIGAVPATHAGRMNAVQEKITAFVQAHEKSRRVLRPAASETDAFLQQLQVAEEMRKMKDMMTACPADLDSFVEKSKERGRARFEAVWEMIGQKFVTEVPTSGLYVASDDRCPFPEQKACRKTLTRLETEQLQAFQRLPDDVRLVHSMVSQQVFLFPSCLTESLALWPSRAYKKDEVVMTISGSWSKFEDVVKLARGHGKSCVIELSFGSKAKPTCRLGLSLRHETDCAFHLHWIPRAMADAPEFLPEGLLLLEPTWCFSTSEDPRIELRATKAMEAFEGELAVCMALVPLEPEDCERKRKRVQAMPGGKKEGSPAGKQPEEASGSGGAPAEAVVAEELEAQSAVEDDDVLLQDLGKVAKPALQDSALGVAAGNVPDLFGPSELAKELETMFDESKEPEERQGDDSDAEPSKMSGEDAAPSDGEEPGQAPGTDVSNGADGAPKAKAKAKAKGKAKAKAEAKAKAKAKAKGEAKAKGKAAPKKEPKAKRSAAAESGASNAKKRALTLEGVLAKADAD